MLSSPSVRKEHYAFSDSLIQGHFHDDLAPVGFDERSVTIGEPLLCPGLRTNFGKWFRIFSTQRLNEVELTVARIIVPVPC